jgi:hypothetical protein
VIDLGRVVLSNLTQSFFISLRAINGRTDA